MAIQRLQRVPRAIPVSKGTQTTVYEIDLSRAPSPAWRAAFLRPPARRTPLGNTPKGACVTVDGPRVTFRTIPARLHEWLRRIDQWIAYANSVVAE